ncbi:MAG: F0F1 ATP synthase subunit A [Myxococcales bacterium]|nr:F0F1 ATP synthase subunit A [Myxococcales bacterium]MDP3500428.1 F0F1 ATP synthase subunit A [Myxococcales bacterium]
MKRVWTFVVAAAVLTVLVFPAFASSGHDEHGEGPKDKASESSEFILHHVADDTEFEFELPFVHLPAIHIAELFGKEPGQGLYLERSPGACSLPLEKSQEAFGSVFKFANGCWDLRPTKAVLSIWIAMGLLALVLFLGRSRDQNGVPRGLFANIIEALLLFVRDEIAVANIGKEEGPKYTPYLATVFFFVLSINYLGLIPGFFTATGVLGVTIALSVITFVMTQIAGIRSAGVVGFFAHLFGDVPVWMKPLMFLVEFLGLFTKPFALLVRLFANMLAGHMVLFFILSLIFVVNIGAAVVSVPLATGLYLLELFVALLQAYIFTLLTALFIGQSVALGHHAHGDDHAPH